MYVCVGAYQNILFVIVASEVKPRHNPVVVRIYKERRLIFDEQVTLKRVFSFSQSVDGRVPKYQTVIKVDENLEGCFDCVIKVLSREGKELEVRSFMTQGTHYKDE